MPIADELETYRKKTDTSFRKGRMRLASHPATTLNTSAPSNVQGDGTTLSNKVSLPIKDGTKITQQVSQRLLTSRGSESFSPLTSPKVGIQLARVNVGFWPSSR